MGERGFGDIDGMRSNGQFFSLEVKTSKGRVTEIQQRVGESIQEHGGFYAVVRSLDDVIREGF